MTKIVSPIKLTAKQERFIQEYLIDLNATQAAIRAGYSKRTANRIATENLSKPGIKDAIFEAQKKLAEEAKLTQQKIIEQLQADHDGAKEAEQYGAAVKATELMGKHIGMFSDRLKIGGDPDAPPIQLVDMPPMPKTIAEWEKQVLEAREQRKQLEEKKALEDKQKEDASNQAFALPSEKDE